MRKKHGALESLQWPVIKCEHCLIHEALGGFELQVG